MLTITLSSALRFGFDLIATSERRTLSHSIKIIELLGYYSTCQAKMLALPTGIVMRVASFKVSPITATESLFTYTLFIAFTTLGETQGEGGDVQVFPFAGVNVRLFAIIAIFSPYTVPTGGDRGAGRVVQGHTPPLSFPRNIATDLLLIFF
jgi:hypothetical protein